MYACIICISSNPGSLSGGGESEPGFEASMYNIMIVQCTKFLSYFMHVPAVIHVGTLPPMQVMNKNGVAVSFHFAKVRILSPSAPISHIITCIPNNYLLFVFMSCSIILFRTLQPLVWV